MLSFFRRLMKNTQGATVIEYTLIASLIAVAAIASMRSVGTKVSSVLGAVDRQSTERLLRRQNWQAVHQMGRLLFWAAIRSICFGFSL